MTQYKEGKASKDTPSRYSLPAWFIERNVKTPSDLEILKDQAIICQCKICQDYQKSYEDIDSDSDDQPPESDVLEADEEEHNSAETHEISHEDAISYAKFSELRDLVATNMLWRHMRPQDSSVLLRRCSVSGCSTCAMEPLLMNDFVTHVAKSLGTALITLSFEDLEELGGDFHAQDKRQTLRNANKQTSEKGSDRETNETTKEKTPLTVDGSAAGASSDNGKEKETQETSDESTTPKQPTKDEWKADSADWATYSTHFFAARSKKWEDDNSISYSAWRDRAEQSYAAILDGALVKAGQQAKPQSELQDVADVASSSRGLLVHFIDCDYSVLPLDYRQKRRILVRLGELVQKRRTKGENVAMVISSKFLDSGEKLCQKAGISSLSNVVLSIVNPSQKAREERDLRRKGDINTRRLRRILMAGITHTDKAARTIEWLSSSSHEGLTSYGQEMWSIDASHHAAAQILARIWMKPELVLSSKHVDCVLRRLKMLTKPKASETADEEKDSEELETISDEVVEEAEQNPLDNITLDEYEERLRDCVVSSKDLNTSWEDVILDHDTKEAMQNLVPSSKLEVEGSSEFLLSQLRIRGCLLYGPPGTGKTHLCRAIAGTSGLRMLSVDYASIQGGIVGEAEKMIRAAFSLAAKLSPCVLFIDEVDSLFYRRSSGDKSWERSAITQFLVEMEGLSQNAEAPLVVVATNRPWDLDEATRALRSSVFLKRDDLDPAVDIDGIASVTKGFSGSDLKNLCAEAALVWKIEQVKLDSLYGTMSPTFSTARKAPKRLRLEVDHFTAAFERMQPNKTEELSEQLERFARRFNPDQGEFGQGNGGKRYIYNDTGRKNEIFSVRDLISRPLPLQEDTPANMQMVVWRSPESMLFPTTVSNQTREPTSLSPASDMKSQKDESKIEACADERHKDSEDGSMEMKVHNLEVFSCAGFDTEKAHTSPDHFQDCEIIGERDCIENSPEPIGLALSQTERSVLKAHNPKSGADVDLLALLVTLAAVFWYS
ncbi:hypothetical protein J7T55_000037 [Diaporthe amygdali]|uniref:uncharacterized protein n=1 Tax=Phomopsis amygdali TaxID=1214568 RepID=UPI0022FDF917|nr:uncharacterized protein J7T55_000037 [Diaporthe amygdali]KAJ0107775.1 hypothetical protein J7T55_000037 [Diaporthe amygdali]